MQKQKYIVEKRIAHYNTGRENEFSAWKVAGETMAVSEEQAIRNVTYNEGIKSYSSLDYDAGNDEEICTEYRARLEDTTDLLKRIERAAADGKPIPDDLPPPETMLYYMLLGVYAAYHSREISAEQGKEQKRQILNTYKRVKEDYEQYVGICKEYQRRIREETIMHYAK